jgi:hypothetical protein
VEITRWASLHQEVDQLIAVQMSQMTHGLGIGRRQHMFTVYFPWFVCSFICIKYGGAGVMVHSVQSLALVLRGENATKFVALKLRICLIHTTNNYAVLYFSKALN